MSRSSGKFWVWILDFHQLRVKYQCWVGWNLTLQPHTRAVKANLTILVSWNVLPLLNPSYLWLRALLLYPPCFLIFPRCKVKAPTSRSPYAMSAGICSRRFPPTRIPSIPSSHLKSDRELLRPTFIMIHHDSLWFIIKCFASSTGEQDGLSANRESSYILHFWRRDLTKRAVARRKRSMFTPFAGQKALNKVIWKLTQVIPSASMGPRNHFANSKLKLYRFVPILRRVEDWPWSNRITRPKVIDGENQWRLLNLLSISSVSKLGSPNFPWLIIVLCIKNCHSKLPLKTAI